MSDRHKDLTGIPLFEGISTDELNQLLFCMQGMYRSYRKGECILHAGDEKDRAGVVLAGTVRMVKTDVWGRETMLTYMDRGELLGETFALGGQPNGAIDFIADEETEVLWLSCKSAIFGCEKACAFHKRLTENLYALLCKKNTALMEKIEISSKPSLREKIMCYLSLQAEKQHSRYITVPLSRSAMAEYLAANRSAMTRELAAMKEDGIIDFDRNTFVIRNRKDTAV